MSALVTSPCLLGSSTWFCFSDRFRTLVNVVGDSLGAGIVNHLSKAELEKMSRVQQLQSVQAGNGKSDGNVAEVHL